MATFRPKRRPLRRKRKSTKSIKVISSVVKKELHKNIENKYAMAYQNNLRVNTNMGGVTGNDLYAVIPSLFQGVQGQTGERIGNRVKPMSLVLNLSFTPNTATPQADWGQYGAYFDLYVFSVKGRQRLENDISSQVATMFRPSIFGGSTDTLYQGLPQDWFKTVNDDTIIIHHRKRFHMSNPYNQGGVNSASNGGSLFKNYTVSLSKKLKANFSYTNTSDAEPNNQAIYATLVCTKSDNVGIDTSNYTLGTVNWSSKLVYEDA